MRHYFAAFIPLVEGGYAVAFPDIPEAFTQGDDLDACMAMAADVLSITTEEYAKARKPLPAACTLSQAQEFASASMQEGPGTDHSRQTLCQLIAAPDVDMTPVRITISLAKSVLETLDGKAKQAGLTRSGFIARATQSFSR